MILSDKDIKKSIKEGRITIDPLFPKSIQPASIDLHLGADFLVFRTHRGVCIDPKNPMEDLMDKVIIDNKKQFIIHPGEFALGMTYEIIGVANDMVGRLEGKSSIGRMGLIIHATAGYLDPGNRLKMTLELHNVSTLPIKLYYKMPIAQMSFTPLSSEAEHPYNKKLFGSKYYGNMKPKASQYWKNFTQNNEWIKFK
ncbi:MAG: Deoxycytidine triphosphate deaminase [Parcubacteria group bacterium GW2011_GWA2_33_14]|uniref:dCTP deaminase, dUMP-forming n=1 Tax=Candidatus Staskawiczbacteria bacterium RIFCSPHIGHO2_02_FULL_33_16 TaxID=1802204 RepID=A0A1G2HTP8_9BACT|nr:MAG: Deoxycytidine triphosphate deaminase [Parcubacteria group bacterium GW2011_GWA2_33_14]OGZ65847.1 MAG: dCTP deaminase [Candidatus Staskawiczbacteria bacterium RIFCSPHIGHO2_02_FULL_33_16]OGZ70503.1 MAG: dCTP deaminase [Candidatus Staskawiczbacteria bacterium RIFCSPLOWO2_01_FULL_33_13]